MRWMNRLATALLVLTVIAGPPLLAGVWLLHHPWQAPTRAQIATWAEQPLTTGTIIGGCLAVAGLAWLLLVIYLTRRAAAELHRRLQRMRHLPVPTPAQMTASSMAGVAAFALPTASTGHLEPIPTTVGIPQPSDAARTDHHADQPAKDEPAGISLPSGGWIPYRTAAAITALAAGVWLHRRRYYRPDPRQPLDHRGDTDLRPLPDAVHTITTAVTNDPATAPGHHAGPLLTHSLPDGILQLTGPGAAAATRGFLITAALSDTSSVFVRTDDVARLLSADHLAGHLTAETGGGPTSNARTVIVLGDDPAATHRWHVTADGTTTGTGLTEPHRLCTLDPQTTVDLLTLADLQHQSAPVDLSPTRWPGQPTPVSEPAVARAASLTMLGGCHLTIAGKPVHLRRTAGLQILAYLAIHPGGASRNDLIHALWPHLPAATIRQRFHTTLTDLRQQLRPLLDQDPVTRHDDRYQLNTRAITTDLQHWHAATQAMTRAISATAQHQVCRNVVDLYRGELAAGHPWPWLIPAREQMRRTVIDACTNLADKAAPGEAIQWLQHAVAVDPYNESLHHLAADVLIAAGDTAGATDVLRRLHRRLAEETDKTT